MADITISPSALSITASLLTPTYRVDMTVSPSVISISVSVLSPSNITNNKTVCMNTKTLAVTEYTNFNYNSYTFFNGKYITLNKTGIYELGRSDDNGEDIVAGLKTGTIDTYTETINRLRDSHITFRSNGDISLKTIGGETNERTYMITNTTDSLIHERRVKFQRGIKDRYFSFELTNINGSTMDVDKIKIEMEPIRKRR